MINNNNQEHILPNEEIQAFIEETLTKLIELIDQKYDEEFVLVEMYLSFKKIAQEMRSSLESLNIIDNDFISEEQRIYNQSLN